MTDIVVSNICASQQPKRRPTAMATTCGNKIHIMKRQDLGLQWQTSLRLKDLVKAV